MPQGSKDRLFFYPQLSKHDWVLTRSPGPGLGNLLFPYARAIVHSYAACGRLLEPTWRNFKFGPYLRREPDKRTYGDLFNHRNGVELFHSLLLRSSPSTEKISESQFLGGKRPSSANMLVVVSGQKNNFEPLVGHVGLVREHLVRKLRQPPHYDQTEIAVHVRMGDFAKPIPSYARNTQLPMEWYAHEIERVRSETSLRRVAVFTDDGTGVAKEYFSKISDVRIVEPVNAATDIIMMSQSQHIICSNSTFSLWAAFLSQGTFSARSPELFSDYGFNAQNMARMR